MNNSRSIGLFVGVDKITVILYVLLLIVGCLSVTSSSFDNSSLDVFDFSHFYIKQITWSFIAMVFAILVLLIDVSIFHKYAYIFYGIGITLLLLTLAVGREVNGAKAWFSIGSFSIQPVEIAKISTALATARIMSSNTFSISKFYDIMKVGGILLLPLAIIILQNDTGSGIVLGSFLFVLYREGLNKWLWVFLNVHL